MEHTIPKPELKIPRISGNPLHLTLNDGEILFVVGANGSGKSALVQHFVSKNRGKNIGRISAHRQTWFRKGSVDITLETRGKYAHEILLMEGEDEARWTDKFAEQRQSILLFDLLARENYRARMIAQHVDVDNMEGAKLAASEWTSLFDEINELLKIANLKVNLDYSILEQILARHQDAKKPFSIAQMSDGERNAVVIAANVLTAFSGEVLLIEEPERHLHRSIIEPFLSALFRRRKDCAFVVTTHEIALPAAHREARTLLVRSCTWNGDRASAWEVELLEANADLPQDLIRAILGSRERVLFVEGNNSSSLDLPLYNALFPGISIVPKGSYSEVEKAVAGLRNAQDHHHVEAFGLIDKDNCSNDEVSRLAKGFVFALDVYSVEALYYCSDAITAVAHWQAQSLGRDPAEMIESATKAGLAALQGDELAEMMAARRSERMVRNQIWKRLPTWKDIRGRTQINFQLLIDTTFPSELARFKKLISNSEFDELVARFPLRESDAFSAVYRSLELNKHHYRQMLIARVRGNESLAQKLRQRVGPLSSILGR